MRARHVPDVHGAEHQPRDAGVRAADDVTEQLGAGLRVGLDHRRAPDHPRVQVDEPEARVLRHRLHEGARHALGLDLREAVRVDPEGARAVPVGLRESTAMRLVVAEHRGDGAGVNDAPSARTARDAGQHVLCPHDAWVDEVTLRVTGHERDRRRTVAHRVRPAHGLVHRARLQQVAADQREPLRRAEAIGERVQVRRLRFVPRVADRASDGVALREERLDQVARQVAVRTGHGDGLSSLQSRVLRCAHAVRGAMR